MKTKYHLIILSAVAVVLIAGCKKNDFKEITGLCPAVESTYPSNGAAGVPIGQGISVSFNENMNPASFIQSSCDQEASITLLGKTSVAGTISCNGKTATFTPFDSLLPGTTYTATITTRATNVEGLSLKNNYVWSFTTISRHKISNIRDKEVQPK